MMGARAWLLLFLLNGSAAVLRPEHVSSCRVLERVANCTDLNLTSFPHWLPNGVHTVDLSGNFLQNLTDIVSFYPTIHQLNLHSNRIEFIQPGLFRSMSHLQVLDLSRNQLDLYAALKIAVGPLTFVQKLDLSGNGLYTDMSDTFLGDAPALTNLSLNGNSITKIGKDTFIGTPALRNIDLHNNVILEIEEGTFESLPHLAELDLSMNSISCITDFNLYQLNSLNLSKNSMTSFQSIISDQDFQLLYLDLRENKIQYFPILPTKNKLIYLDLSRNQLHSLNGTDADEELHNHKSPLKLCSLLYLDLSYNHLKSIPPDFFVSMVALESLNISNNCLESFMLDHRSLNTLKTLDLSFNNLQNLTFGNCTLEMLETLYLQGNWLNTLDPGIFQGLPSIRTLHLQQNQLSVCGLEKHVSGSCVYLSDICTLQYLYLSENDLLYLPAQAFKCSPLLILDLSLNPGVEINEHALSGLERFLTHLSLRGNQLQVLNFDLSLLHHLKVVDLSSNQLSSLLLASGDTAIESLNLQNNSMVTLETHTLKTLQNTLRNLYMGSNPLSCCRNMQLIDLVQQKSVHIPDIAMVTCKYRKDGEYVEINLRNVQSEHCETLRSKVLVISMITVLTLGLMVVLLVAIRLCHSRSHRFNHSYKA
ncbi:transforming growth factor beta activator LRRC32 [Brachyhypopomus gauderio]|uniref:transforming growth factor beta activator LRRC32 n=1 Tax=Brachyhypopomus gauderio TaxID=698409 RepID=UPI004042231D